MPDVKPGESRSDYVSRCVVQVMGEGLDQRAALGKCEGMYDSYVNKAQAATRVACDARDAALAVGASPAQARMEYDRVYKSEVEKEQLGSGAGTPGYPVAKSTVSPDPFQDDYAQAAKVGKDLLGAVLGGVAKADTRKEGETDGKSNELGQGGRAQQLEDEGVPGGVIGEIARRKQAAPGQKNYH